MDNKQKINKKLYTFGFETYKLAFFNSKEFLNLKQLILDEVPYNIPKTSKIMPSKIKLDGQNFIKKYTNNQNLLIPYMHNDQIKKNLLNSYNNPTNNDLLDIISYIKQNIEFKNILDIPITFQTSEIQNGCTKYYYVYGKLNNMLFYKLLPPILYDIKIEGPLNEFSSGIYIHEMYHALSKRNKGYTKNYLFDETISIFMEKIFALENNLLDKSSIRRISIIKDSIQDLNNPNNIIENQKYITSFLMSLCLFDIYFNSSNNIKKEIIQNINEIINGYQLLENILEKYEITPEKGINIVENEIKFLKKYIHK